MASDRATFAALPRHEQVLFVHAWVLAPVVVLSLRLVGYGRTHAAATRLLGHRPEPSDPAQLIDGVVRMVDAGISRSPVTATCLPRSLLVWFLLGRRGVTSRIVIGVRPGGVPLDAHAWVERIGEPIGDTPEHTGSYFRLERGESS